MKAQLRVKSIYSTYWSATNNSKVHNNRTSLNIITALTTVAVPQLPQTPPDELVLPPVLVPKLQMEKPLTTISIPYCTSPLEPLPSTSTDYKTELLSLEMFTRAATNLNERV